MTLDGETHKLESLFIVLATQNPIELEGTYPLPEAQLDRFLMKIKIGYPNRDQEKEILRRRMIRKRDEFKLNRIASPRTVTEMQRSVEQVHVDDDVLGYMVDLVQATREYDRVEVGASPRGSLALFKLSRAHAFLHGRDYVTPDDVKYVAIPALCHRVLLKAESWVRGVNPESILEQILTKIPVPKVE